MKALKIMLGHSLVACVQATHLIFSHFSPRRAGGVDFCFYFLHQGKKVKTNATVCPTLFPTHTVFSIPLLKFKKWTGEIS